MLEYLQGPGDGGQAQAPGAQERPLGHAVRRGVCFRALDHRIRPLPHRPGILIFSTVIINDRPTDRPNALSNALPNALPNEVCATLVLAELS